MSDETSPARLRLATVERLLQEIPMKAISSFKAIREPLAEMRESLEREKSKLVESVTSELGAAAAEVARELGLSESDAGYYRGDVINKASGRAVDDPEFPSPSHSAVRTFELAIDEQRRLLRWIKEVRAINTANGAA